MSPSVDRPEDKACFLCGRGSRRPEIFRTPGGEVLYFCCPGCLCVFQVLFSRPEGPPSDYRDTELYRACAKAGLLGTGGGAAEGLSFAASNSPPPGSPVPEPSETGRLAQELTVRIEGMWCGACAWLIEESLRKIGGVLAARVFFLTDIARIRYFPHLIGPTGILSGISRLGYKGSLMEDAADDPGGRKFLYRFGLSAILSMNIMMISFALYGGFFQELGKEGIEYLSYPIWLLATPVVFYGGFPILNKAVRGLAHGMLTMDTLIAVGSLSAYFYSFARMLQGSLHLYFDVASMLITMVLLGRFIELRARGKVSKGLVEFQRLARSKARLLLDGMERWVRTESVEPGEEFLVMKGERVPLDGELISGGALLDESILTGESRPVRREPGEEVAAGALVLDGDPRFRATRSGSRSSLNRMLCLVQEALSRKNPVELLADRITRRLVPAVLILAAGTAVFLIWRGTSADEALMRALTVLVITCPCALGIATPLAKVASIEVGRSKGILVSDPGALEKAKDLQILIFDKTGTLTEGRFCLREIFCPGLDQREVLSVVASVESNSGHFLAREILRAAGEQGIGLEEAKDSEVRTGLGVEGTCGSVRVSVGNRRLMALRGLQMTEETDDRAKSMEEEGFTAVFFGWSGLVFGCLVFGDRLKEGASEVIGEFHKRGIEVRVISGDSEKTTRAVSLKLGIVRHMGEALPGDKARIIRDLRNDGYRVGMIGDGINDSAALARADVGIALGAAANMIVHEAADVTILSSDLRRVHDFLDLSNLAARVIRQNLVFASLYNAVGIPLAVLGAMNPLVAVLAMFASSLTVVGNTLRISRRGHAPESGGAEPLSRR